MNILFYNQIDIDTKKSDLILYAVLYLFSRADYQ